MTTTQMLSMLDSAIAKKNADRAKEASSTEKKVATELRKIERLTNKLRKYRKVVEKLLSMKEAERFSLTASRCDHKAAFAEWNTKYFGCHGDSCGYHGGSFHLFFNTETCLWTFVDIDCNTEIDAKEMTSAEVAKHAATLFTTKNEGWYLIATRDIVDETNEYFKKIEVVVRLVTNKN